MNWLEKIYELEAQKKNIEKELKDAWGIVQTSGVKEDGAYTLLETAEQVRKIDAQGFRDWFGPKIFMKVAKVGVTDAVKEVGENKLEEGNKMGKFISFDERVKKKVIKS